MNVESTRTVTTRNGEIMQRGRVRDSSATPVELHLSGSKTHFDAILCCVVHVAGVLVGAVGGADLASGVSSIETTGAARECEKRPQHMAAKIVQKRERNNGQHTTCANLAAQAYLTWFAREVHKQSTAISRAYVWIYRVPCCI